MTESYELLLEYEVCHTIKKLRGKRKAAIIDFLDYLEPPPFYEPEIVFEDHKRRNVNKVTVLNYVLTYSVDHPMKEIKVLEIHKIK